MYPLSFPSSLLCDIAPQAGKLPHLRKWCDGSKSSVAIPVAWLSNRGVALQLRHHKISQQHTTTIIDTISLSYHNPSNSNHTPDLVTAALAMNVCQLEDPDKWFILMLIGLGELRYVMLKPSEMSATTSDKAPPIEKTQEICLANDPSVLSQHPFSIFFILFLLTNTNDFFMNILGGPLATPVHVCIFWICLGTHSVSLHFETPKWTPPGSRCWCIANISTKEGLTQC